MSVCKQRDWERSGRAWPAHFSLHDAAKWQRSARPSSIHAGTSSKEWCAPALRGTPSCGTDEPSPACLPLQADRPDVGAHLDRAGLQGCYGGACWAVSWVRSERLRLRLCRWLSVRPRPPSPRILGTGQLTKMIGDALRSAAPQSTRASMGRGPEASITVSVTLRLHRPASGIAASCVGVNAFRLYVQAMRPLLSGAGRWWATAGASAAQSITALPRLPLPSFGWRTGTGMRAQQQTHRPT